MPRLTSAAAGPAATAWALVRVAFAILVLLAVIVARAVAGPIARGKSTPFEATAYTVEGKTAQGTRTREGIVAADPALLPLGTRIRVRHAGRYCGDYVVRDTGRTIKGREIDLYLANDAEAKRFGRKRVAVEVLSRGDDRPAARK